MNNTNVVRGIVQNIKEKQTKYGTMYDLRVDGKFYGVGKNHPGCNVGETVEFAVKQNGDFTNVVGSVNKVAASEVVTRAPAAEPPTTTNPAQSTNNSYDSRQLTISFQAARNAAIEFLKFMQTAGALPFSEATTAKAKQSKQSAAEGLLDHYTEVFYNDTQELGARFIGGAEQVVEQEDEWTS